MHDTQNLPPQNLDAEMSILGGILIDNDSISRVLESIVPEDFYREAHRKVFLAMMQLSDKREPCDLVTLTETLKMNGELDEIGGAAYLLMLVDYVPTAANITYYCKIVKKKSFFRRLIRTGTEIVAMGYGENDGADDLLESALIRLTVPTKTEPVGAEILVIEATHRLKERYDTRGQIHGIPYGIAALDSATCGMHRGELIIMAGRPSMGKTAAAMNVVENACELGHAAMVFSLEMDRGSIIDRMIASRGGIRYGNIRSGNLQQIEWVKYTRCSEAISRYRLVVDDTPAISLSGIRSKARKQKMKGLDLVVVDYLQLVTVSSKENRTQAIGELSRGLKQLARELDCAVILLSQLNRAVDGRPDKRPTMSDLRDSGEIEQDADVILFPFRQAAYCPKCKDKINDENHNLVEHLALAEMII
jgi:replicative DNA helicase